jgi:hypothetical protein
MSIRVKLIDGLGKLLGASWVNPIKSALFGGGGGDYHSPISFTAVPAGSDSVTLSGINPTITDVSQFQCVRSYDSTGRRIGEWYPSSAYKFVWDSTGSVLTVDGANWESAAFLDVELHAEHRAYAPTEDAYQNYVVNPEHAWTQQSTLVDVTDETDSTIYYYVDFDGYKFAGFQIDLGCLAGTVTATLEASMQDDGTAQASCAYQDVTNDLFGVANLQAAAGTASDMWVIDTPFPTKFLRVKIVYATGANSGDATIYFRGIY